MSRRLVIDTARTETSDNHHHWLIERWHAEPKLGGEIAMSPVVIRRFESVSLHLMGTDPYAAR